MGHGTGGRKHGRQEVESMEDVEGGEGYKCGEGGSKEFARAGWVLKRPQREGVQRVFDAHAQSLKRRIR